MAIHYTFSTTTTDSDPGAGFLRLDDSPQENSTQAFVDLLDSFGEDWTDAIDSMDFSTNITRGYVRLVARDDPTKWILSQLTGVVVVAGYRKLQLVVVDSSDSNPFANNDPIVLHFTATGDAGISAAEQISGIEVEIGDGTSVITTGIAGWLEIPFDCEIEAVRLVADVTGSIVIDIWSEGYASLPATDADSITGGNEPELTTDLTYEDNVLTGWTTPLAAGEWLYFNVDSATTVTRVTLSLSVVRI